MPKPRCLNPAANSLDFRIAGRRVHKPRCLSPAANSLYSRIAGCQVSKPRCLSPDANILYSTTNIDKKNIVWGPRAGFMVFIRFVCSHVPTTPGSHAGGLDAGGSYASKNFTRPSSNLILSASIHEATPAL